LLLAIFQEVQESQPDKLIRMTHQSMAAATGRTRVSVTHALSKIQEAGAIRLSRASIEVLDAKILGELSMEPAA
jgi:CRP-like cAMP-binding protein